MQTANSSWSPDKDGWSSVHFEQDSGGSGKAGPEPTFWWTLVCWSFQRLPITELENLASEWQQENRLTAPFGSTWHRIMDACTYHPHLATWSFMFPARGGLPHVSHSLGFINCSLWKSSQDREATFGKGGACRCFAKDLTAHTGDGACSIFQHLPNIKHFLGHQLCLSSPTVSKCFISSLHFSMLFSSAWLC